MYLSLFLTLYMFRAHRAHHQEGQILSVQPLVAVNLCRWPCRVQVGSSGGRLLVGVLRHPTTTFPLQSVLTQAVHRQATRNSHRE